MKQAFLIACIVMLIVGCNDKTASTNAVISDTPATAVAHALPPAPKLDYPYTLEQPYKNWQPGNQQHAVTVMKGLKAYENGDVDGCMVAFGDSIDLKSDGFRNKFSNDSLRKFFTKARNNMKSLKVKMGDWESVISEDKKDEYVTLWYKEITVDKKGKTDSLSVVEDFKMVNGKIVELDSKLQHFPVSKKM